jgi:hypothetical protein
VAPTVESFDGQPIAITQSVLAPDAIPGLALHSVSFANENGTRVVKIRVSPDGDELIVDARTGRLIEARPPRSTAGTPKGRFAAPFVPVT